MKLKYIGESFGASSLTNDKIYECIGVDKYSGNFRVIDDSGEDYLYSPINPRPLSGDSMGGSWEIVEDDETESAKKLIRLWEDIRETPELYNGRTVDKIFESLKIKTVE